MTKEEKKEYDKKRYAANKDLFKQNNKEYYEQNIDKIKQHRVKNADKIKYAASLYRIKNKQKLNDYNNRYNKAYRINNLEKIKRYRNNRCKIDLYYRLTKNLRARFGKALQRNTKVGSAVKDLGCSIEEFKKYIESKFKAGMTWDNYGKSGWHLDHILPLASFDLTQPNQLRIALHYTNYQPLWAKDNLSKADLSFFTYK